MVKNCNKCHLDREIGDFYFVNKGRTRRSTCKYCYKRHWELWNKNHPNANKERYARDKDKMLLRTKIWSEKNKEKIKEQRFERYTNNIPKILLRASLHRAKIKGMEHTLKVEDIKIPEICPVLGIPISHQRTGGTPHPNSPSIDRIDNTKGYTKDNIIIVSRRANVLKNDASLEELKKIVTFYDNFINKG